MPEHDETDQLRNVALRNAQSILHARLRADEDLRRHSEWLRVTLASIGDAVISTDADGRVNFMNLVAESLTGWPQSEALGRPLDDIFRIVNEHTRAPVDNPAARALREGVRVALANHTILIARDGVERPIDDCAAPVTSADGSVIGCVLIFRDVSERRRAEVAAGRSERDLSDFFENANVGLHWVGPDGTILRANQAELNLLGYSHEEYVGHHISEFHTDPAAISDIMARLTRGESLQGYPARLRCKDGSTRNVIINSSVHFENGKFIRTRSFTLDVTDRQNAQEAQALLAAIVETSDDAIVSKSLDGIIRSWNSAAERLFGYSAAEAVGRSIDLIIPPELREEERSILRTLRAGGRVDHFETVRVTKDGRRINISISISPIKDPKGRVIGASKVARDITERKRAETERESLLASERHARAEAERAGRLKDEFLATLSHELRTPLNAILGWIHILRKKTPAPEMLEQGLAVIDRNARIQTELIADLLDMSRIISGKTRLDIQRVEMPVVIEAALDSVRPAADAKDVRIQSILQPIPGAVYADPARLQQIIWNLLSNAVKFTPRGGRVQVALSHLHSHIVISVADSGQGISPDFLPHVFERFRQADSSATRVHGGLGLGLSIVKHLVELHGGSVRAASDGEGRGSTFTVQLPVAPDQSAIEYLASYTRSASRPAHPSTEPPGLGGLCVLVVDDEADTRDLIRRVLEESQARVILASSADEALALLSTHSPDVILSDIGMPVRDGYSLITSVRQQGVKTPAAAITAFARSEDQTRALRAGYQTHIAKPVDPVELVTAVAALAGAGPEGMTRGRS